MQDNQGVIKTYLTISDKFFIPNLIYYLWSYIKGFHICQLVAKPTLWDTPICLDTTVCLGALICLDALMCLDTTICLDSPMYLDAPPVYLDAPPVCFGCPPVCLDATICWILPCMFGHPYVWMPLNMWTLPYVWMPPYVWKMFGCLLYIYNTKKTCFVRCRGYPYALHTFGCPYMFEHPQYVWVPLIYLDAPPVCLDAPYVWITPYMF